jgi:hypothetical protein
MIRCLQKNFNTISEGRSFYYVRDSLKQLKNIEMQEVLLRGRKESSKHGQIAMENKCLSSLGPEIPGARTMGRLRVFDIIKLWITYMQCHCMCRCAPRSILH